MRERSAPSSSQARGRPYQRLVAEVARAFDEGATVSEGEWVRGPDGRLDMDVSVRGIIDGRKVLVAIECKDFRPGSTGPVGRAYVDALDSKRHDLKADLAIICSNSGFTKDALSKAKRKGIGMISVLCAGDRRVKVVIEEQMYLRRIIFTFWEPTFYAIGETLKFLAPAHDQILFMGRPVSSWLQLRASLIACTNPTLEHIQANFNFMNPLNCQVGSSDVALSACL
jgi:Restriction endonuclease